MLFARELARFDLSDMIGFVFIGFLFGQSIGKANKLLCILNTLDVLRESLILVSGGFLYEVRFAFAPSFYSSMFSI